MIKKRSARYIAAETIIIYFISAAAYAWALLPMQSLYFDDGYYHYRIAQMLMSGHAWIDISWLPMTILGDAGPDHHWFWHLIIAPFTMLGRSDIESLKLATAFTGALVPAALSLSARLLGLPFAPLIGLLAVASNWILPFRYLMLRAQTISIILIFFGIVALYRRSVLMLFIVAFVFMNAYHGAIILVPITLIWLFIDHSIHGEFRFQMLLGLLAGLLLALALSPWAPKTFEYLLFHTVYKMMSSQHLNVGLEWYPISWWLVLRNGIVGHLLLLSGAAIFYWQRVFSKNPVLMPGTLSMVLYFISIILIFSYKSASRFAEYLSPMEVFAGISLLKDSLAIDASEKIRKAVLCALVLLVILGTFAGLWLVRDSNFYSTNMYKKTSAYLDEHGQPGDIILNPDWTSFVYVFWYTQKFRMVSGLDPHYLAYASPQPFTLWQIYEKDHLTKEDPALLGRDIFHAKWILIDSRYENLRAALMASPNARLVIDDGTNGILFQIF